MPTLSGTCITTIRTIAVPASDQDRTMAFFIENLGFELGMDAELAPGFRWIEVAPPGSAVSVAIVASSSTHATGIDTGIRFLSSDAEADHASMKAKGVDVGEMLLWPNVPAMFVFRDIDANVYYVSESGAEDPRKSR